jgi:hypothetical protein
MDIRSVSSFSAYSTSGLPAQAPGTPQTPDAHGQHGGEEAAKTDPRTGVSSTNRLQNPGTPGNPELSEDDRKEVEELRKRDAEVRAHEAAHKAAAGSLARGAATYTYETGPDGQRYAVGGEVSIDIAAIPGDAQATLQKAETVRAAALAPADPSSQDRAVAAEAARMAAEARAELNQQTLAGAQEAHDTPANGATAYQQVQQQAHDPAAAVSAFRATA